MDQETYHEDRPWGSFDTFVDKQLCTVKILTIAAGQKFSLQYHEHRSEFWRVIGGEGSVIIGDETIECKIGDEYKIPQGTIHRAIGGEKESLQLLEIMFGDYDEEDIVRLEDTYGRT